MSVFINFICNSLPNKRLTNEDLSRELIGWDSNKIFSKTGIKERRIASELETALDISYIAAKKAVTYSFENHLEIDYLIYVSQTNDYIIPGNSTLLLNLLGLRNIPCIDLNLACSGYIYALQLAYSLISSSQAKTILLVTSDTYSKIINKKDKSVRTLFGDGSSASIVSNASINNNYNFEILDFLVSSDGQKFDSLFIKSGGFKFPIDILQNNEKIDGKGYVRKDSELFMNGEEVFNFTIEFIPKNISSLLLKNKITKDQVKYFFLHQANKFILNYINNIIDVGDKLVIDLEFTGNTTSSSIPILISNNIDKYNILNNDYLVMSGFGVGLSWGSALLKKVIL